ncbi:MAG: dihydroorotase [Leptonema sp. (in: Bacteria)]|nr:dihydroorotase [Leptonema sp. (in: bacteria)]
MTELRIRTPDDFHIHLRDGDSLKLTAIHAAKQFQRAIIMPNLVLPVDSVLLAGQYQKRILDLVSGFEPLMTLYLTENITPAVIDEAANTSFIKAVKLYPAGATTHSDSGVTNLSLFDSVFEAMQKNRMPLLIHGEVTDTKVDVFDREAVFIDRYLLPLRRKFPELKIVLEHVSSKLGVDFVKSESNFTAATITIHHLWLTRNDLLVGGLKPHYYCLPIVKTEQDRIAIQQAAFSGDSRFFAGTDSAPHLQSRKEAISCAAGIYTAYAAIELYAQLFEEAGQLSKLESFLAEAGAKFYGLPLNTETVLLKKQTWQVPDYYNYDNGRLIPFQAGQTLLWKLDATD